MQQNKSQEEVRRTIISDMVKKRNSIVPVIGEKDYTCQKEGDNSFLGYVNSYSHADNNN